MKKSAPKNNSGTQFPSNYRTITERSTFLLVILSILGLVFFNWFLSARIISDYQTFKQISSQRQQILGKVNSWSSILEKFPGYSDAAFNLAILYFQLNNLENSRSYLEKTLVFDPNYPEANILDKELKKRGF